jgi:renal tumor antigen
MKALDHMHKKGIFHRDIKPENILIESSSSEQGRGLKLADFGSCRGIYSKQPYTEYISTRWYRAPECLLTDGYYGPEMDLWGAGCVMFEITSLYPLFPGQNEVDQIARIHKVLGTPTAEGLAKFKSRGASHISFDFPPQRGVGIPQLVPHASADAIDLMVKLLKYDASERITAREAMRHPYFKDVREAEAKQTAEAKISSNGTANEKASTGGSYEVKAVAPSGGAHADGGSSMGGKNLPSITGAGAQQMESQYAKQSVRNFLSRCTSRLTFPLLVCRRSTCSSSSTRCSNSKRNSRRNSRRAATTRPPSPAPPTAPCRRSSPPWVQVLNLLLQLRLPVSV